MSGKTIKITASEGGEFDCYLALPDAESAPAAVIMASVYGVDDDVKRNIDDLAAKGFIAAGPDLFWRGDKGPMTRSEEDARRAKQRAADRFPLIEQGVKDLVDVIAALKNLPQCNGHIVPIGLCYGGPYAILGPARLGCSAGIAFHGTKVENYLDELKTVDVPIRLHWGDQDHAAPPPALEKIQAAAAVKDNVEVVVYPGILHGYTAPASGAAWNEEAAQHSWQSAFHVLQNLSTK